MKENKLKIGDKVKVIDIGCFYTTYYDMAKKMFLSRWVDRKPLCKGAFATVIAMEDHGIENDIVIGIETSNLEQYMIGYQGLELTDEIETDKVIKIPRNTLNEYFENATKSQRQYINDNFKIDGTTTVDAIVGLEAIACNDWKPIIKKNHPTCFPKPEFNFSKYESIFGHNIFSQQQSELLGFDESPIQIRNFNKYKHKGFYLTRKNNVKWEIKEESCGGQVLIPIFK